MLLGWTVDTASALADFLKDRWPASILGEYLPSLIWVIGLWGILTMLWVVLSFLETYRVVRESRPFCKRCGYDLSGTVGTNSNCCPECGKVFRMRDAELDDLADAIEQADRQ